MCGINGIISLKQNNQLVNVVNTMNDLIVHRGPNDDGIFIDDNRIFMGMRRLSIIDLNNGKQPISNNDGTITIVLNGEIYNYKELREKLLRKGATFKTNSDTEVVLKMYEFYGKEFLKELDGMYAFSIHDKSLNKVIIARDFFGEKPLYYTQNSDQFIWASELKSIIKTQTAKPNINVTALNIYFQLTYIPAPFTIYDGIFKLEANHYLEFNCSNFKFQIHKIEQPIKNYPILSKPEAIKITHDLVFESVKSRSISDVPIGTFLSGGVDSSIISFCLAQQNNTKIDTFSIGFEDKNYNETAKSKEIAKLINSNHHEFILKPKDFIEKLNDILLNFDEPYADSSALPSFIVANETSKFVKVALTGDGGDEVFGGYNKYYIGKLNKKYTQFIPKKLHNNLLDFSNNFLTDKNDSRGNIFKLIKFLKSVDYNNEYYYNIISLGFLNSEIKEILLDGKIHENCLDYFKKKYVSKPTTLSDYRNIDRFISLEGDLLVKVDRTSMLNSLECRSPFLNKKIWNFTNQLPENWLINGFDKKHILKEAFKDYFPKDFLNKSKKGFGVPVGNWLKSELKSQLLNFTEEEFIQKQAIFNYSSISKMVNDHLSGKLDSNFKVWTFYCFQIWWINNND